MSDARSSSLIRRLWLRLLATAGVAAAVLLSWWWKIEDARAPSSVPRAEIGQTIDLGQTRLTPLDLTVTSDGTVLTLHAIAENATSKTEANPFGIPTTLPAAVIDGEALPDPEVNLVRASTGRFILQPRMPEEITLVWTSPTPLKGKEVQLRFMRQTFKLHDNLYGQAMWLGFVPSAKLELVPEERG